MYRFKILLLLVSIVAGAALSVQGHAGTKSAWNLSITASGKLTFQSNAINNDEFYLVRVLVYEGDFSLEPWQSSPGKTRSRSHQIPVWSGASVEIDVEVCHNVGDHCGSRAELNSKGPFTGSRPTQDDNPGDNPSVVILPTIDIPRRATRVPSRVRQGFERAAPPSGPKDAPEATATMPAPETCADMPPDVQVEATGGLPQCQRLKAWQLGLPSPIPDFIDAVDVWSWVTPDTQVCFSTPGDSLKFIDTAPIPRAVYGLPAYSVDGMTCATIHRPGIVVLVSSAAPAPAHHDDLGNCMVTTSHIVNFRQSPAGEQLFIEARNGHSIAGQLPPGVTLTALARTTNWMLVDYYGAQGWISAYYVATEGDCG